MKSLLLILAALSLPVSAYTGTGDASAGTPPAAGPEALALTPAEKNWIKSHPVIRVGHHLQYPPYSFRNQAGEMVGANLSYLSLITQKCGLRFVAIPVDNVPAEFGAFKSGRIDLLMNLGRTAEREGYMLFTRPYGYGVIAVVRQDEAEFAFGAQRLNGHRVGLPIGFAAVSEFVRQMAPQAEIVEYANMAEVLRAVSRGEVYATIGEFNNCAYLAETLRLDNLRISGMLAEPINVYMGVRKDWPELAGILDKAINQVTVSERLHANDAWLDLINTTDRSWLRIFKLTAAIAAVVLVVFGLSLLYTRRLARELRERRRVEVRLSKVNAELKAMSQEKDALVNIVAHDLRNPLTAILLGADTLRLAPPGDREQLLASADLTKKNARKMMDLIDDLLDAHKLEAAVQTLDFQPVEPAAIVLNAIEAFTPLAAHKGIRLVHRLSPAATLITDAKALQHVIDNVLSNAVKYSALNTQVSADLEARTDRCRISVRDQGPGVKPAELEKIFTQYGRGSARPTSGETSFGLGLWIVHRLVQSLGGQVWCESAPGAGATFIVELPLDPSRGLPPAP
ncbi:MAG: ATP-binding protein [Opitutales bacterium]